VACDSSWLVSLRQEVYCDGSKSVTASERRLGWPCENVRGLYVVECVQALESLLRMTRMRK